MVVSECQVNVENMRVSHENIGSCVYFGWEVGRGRAGV